MKKKTGLLLSTLTFMTISSNVLAQGGSLDKTFNPSGAIPGTVGTSFTNSTGSQAYGVAIQPTDLKIVTAGTAGFSGGVNQFALVRYNTDGSLDTTFGSSGTVLTSISGGNDQANSIALQSDGKILVAGFASVSATPQFAIARYNTDGSLDTAFGNSGIQTTSIGGVDDEIFSVVVQSDGKILVGGLATISGAAQFALARYNTDGSLDSSFGTSGIVTTAINTTYDKIFSVVIQSNGKIVAAGYTIDNSGLYLCALSRYNSNGTLDTSFGTSGIVITQVGTINDQIRDIALQSDGKIVAAGTSSYQPNLFEFIVMRYNTNGTLDTSFGVNGITQTQIGTTSDAIANSVGIKERGKVLVAGFSSNDQVTLARYDQDGTLDTTFGNNGIVRIENTVSEANSLALYGNNKQVIVAGFIGIAGSNKPEFLAARYFS